MEYNKKTKIVCTIGPASWDQDVLRRMVANGMNVARINGAFADNAELERVEKLVRSASNEVALMLDIKGHEVRLNKFAESLPIKPGDVIEIGKDESSPIFPITFPDLYKDLEVGTILIFDDGNIEGVLREITPQGVMKVEITFGESLKPGKSINTPGVTINNPSLTERDKEQINFCKNRGWDFVAASFIRSQEDALMVVDQVKGTHMKVIAKIEDQAGIDNFDEILEVVEGIMIARGDLGVEIPFERIPLVQSEMIFKCNAKGKPVITATQMLESMTENPRPTRAEITDVANAVIQGSDAIMLSGESSAGKYPSEAVAVMNRIAKEVEPNLPPEIIYERADAHPLTDALTKSAFQMAFDLEDQISTIIVVSRTGKTARLLARYHLKQPIYAFVSADHYRRRLSLSRGVTKAFTFDVSISDRDEAIRTIIGRVKEEGLADTGSQVLVIGNGLADTSSSYFPNIFEVIKL